MRKAIAPVFFILALIVLFSAGSAFAQGPPPPPPQNEIPLDGFSIMLIAAGAGYGAKRAMDRKPSLDK